MWGWQSCQLLQQWSWCWVIVPMSPSECGTSGTFKWQQSAIRFVILLQMWLREGGRLIHNCHLHNNTFCYNMRWLWKTVWEVMAWQTNRLLRRFSCAVLHLHLNFKLDSENNCLIFDDFLGGCLCDCLCVCVSVWLCVCVFGVSSESDGIRLLSMNLYRNAGAIFSIEIEVVWWLFCWS